MVSGERAAIAAYACDKDAAVLIDGCAGKAMA